MSHTLSIKRIVAVVAIGLSALSVSATAAWSPPTNTDVCWRTKTTNGLVQLRFIPIGTQHYQFVGKIVEASGLINPIFGNFIVTPKKLIGSSTLSGANASNFWGEISNLSINRTTKVLTYKGVGLEKASKEPFYDNSTASFIPCP